MPQETPVPPAGGESRSSGIALPRLSISDLFLSRRREGARGLPALVALAIGVALVAYGQRRIDEPLPGWVPLDFLQDRLIAQVYRIDQSVLLSFAIFVVGAALFAFATRGSTDGEASDRAPALSLAALRRGRWGWVASGSFLGGFAAWSYLIVRLLKDDYGERHPMFFALAVVAMTAPFLRWDWAAGLRPKLSIHWWEPPLLIALALTFTLLNVRDLDNWRYSFIGDEGAFLDVARAIDSGFTFNLFGQQGAYGYHPILTSAYQALSLKVFGHDYFGWKMASVLAVVATIPTFYLFLRLAFGVRPAVFGTVFFSASFYLFAYAHTGYNNIFAIFPVVTAFALFFLGLRSGSATAFWAAGLMSALAFYSFFPARAAIVILAAFVLTMGWRWWRPSLALPISLGFIIGVVPIFAVDRWEVIGQMLDQSAGVADDPLLQQVLQNVPRSLFAFNFNPNEGHYVSGALLDGLSAVLAVLGIGYAISRLRSGPYRFLLVWWLISLVATGVFFRYENVAYSRLHIVLPVMAAFAGIALHRILLTVEESWRLGSLRAPLTVAALAFVAPVVFLLNVHLFWDEAAHRSPTTQESVAVRAVREGPCAADAGTVVVSENSDFAIAAIFRTYGLPEGVPAVAVYRDAAVERIETYPCVVLMNPDNESARLFLTELERAQPQRLVEELRDLSGMHRVVVLRLLP